MTCTVILPAPLRNCAGGVSSLKVRGETVGAVLRELGREYKSLIDKVCEAGGEIRSSVNVYVNDRDIRHLSGLDTAVREGDEVVLVPAIAGG